MPPLNRRFLRLMMPATMESDTDIGGRNHAVSSG